MGEGAVLENLDICSSKIRLKFTTPRQEFMSSFAMPPLKGIAFHGRNWRAAESRLWCLWKMAQQRRVLGY